MSSYSRMCTRTFSCYFHVAAFTLLFFVRSSWIGRHAIITSKYIEVWAYALQWFHSINGCFMTALWGRNMLQQINRNLNFSDFFTNFKYDCKWQLKQNVLFCIIDGSKGLSEVCKRWVTIRTWTFEFCLLFKSNSLICVSKISFIRYRFQIYNRPVSFSVKVNESYKGDGSFDAALIERHRLSLETYMYIKHIQSGTTKSSADWYTKGTVRLGMKQRGLWCSLPFGRKAESIMRLWWRQWTCGATARFMVRAPFEGNGAMWPTY
jgi:hypothetical protein